MSVPPRPRRVISEPQCSRLRFSPHCQRCGKSEVIAYGYNAEAMTRSQLFERLDLLGWVVVPRMLCRSCGSPMTWEEMRHYETLAAEDADAFYFAMIQKYGQAADKWFRSKDADRSWHESRTIVLT